VDYNLDIGALIAANEAERISVPVVAFGVDADAREAAAAEVRAIYREWEARPLERNCTGRGDCCRFRMTGRTPFLTKGEALVAALAWRAAGRTSVPETADGACPFLKGVRCQIYEGRP
jgi:hypothetical protein